MSDTTTERSIAVMHQIEGLVDLRERQLVRDEFVERILPSMYQSTILGSVRPARPQTRALPHASRDELERPRRYLLPGLGPDDYRLPQPR